jgi:Flp pilus assembly protein TadB
MGGSASIPAWAPWLVAALLFLAIVVAVLGLAWPRSSTADRIGQIEHFGPSRTTPSSPPAEESASAGTAITRTALAATASVVRSGRVEERIRQRLERAGMRLQPHEWVLLRFCVMVAAAAGLFTVAAAPGAVLGAALAWVSTLLYQTFRIDRRSTQFAEQLPDALQLVIGSLKSGFSLPQALDSLVRESSEPVSVEFGRALAEHRLGADVSDALERMAQRVRNDDLRWTIMAVRIQREVGGNLAEVLQTTVDTMRERSRLRRHVRSLSAEGRLSAWILIGLPLFIGLFMFFYRRDYVRPLYTEPEGITMLLGGGLLFVIGIFWLIRVVRVEA